MSLLLATGGAAAQSATRPLLVARLVEALQDVDLARPMQLRAGVAGQVRAFGLSARLFDEANWESEAFLHRNTFAGSSVTTVPFIRMVALHMDEAVHSDVAIRQARVLVATGHGSGPKTLCLTGVGM